MHRVLQHRARALVALLALALAAWALAACGGNGGGGGSGDAQTLLKQTFTGIHTIKSGKANVHLNVDLQGDTTLTGPIKLTVSGPFQSAGAGQIPKFDLALDAGAQGQGIKAGLISTSDRIFVTVGGTAYEVPAQFVTQLKQSFAKSQQSSSSKSKLDLGGLGLDPLGWLSGATVVGKETVGGVETEHIRAQLNVGALLDDVDKLLAKISEKNLGAATGGKLPKSIPSDVRSQIEEAVKRATVDVWTGADDKTLRKLALALSIQPKNGGKLKSADIAFSIELSDLNQPQTVQAPANPRPLSELLGQFQGLFGGSIPGLSGGSGGSGAGANAQQVDKYAQCIKDAGTDVQKAQDCASLLTK